MEDIKKQELISLHSLIYFAVSYKNTLFFLTILHHIIEQALMFNFKKEGKKLEFLKYNLWLCKQKCYTFCCKDLIREIKP